MVKTFRRPKDEEELKLREAAGLWNAQALAKDFGESQEKITIEMILNIHRVFFQNANPDIAGKFRIEGQDVKKLACMEPPPGRVVTEKMYAFWRDLDLKLSTLPKRAKSTNKKQKKEWMNEILSVATWIQYQIAAIHPFCEGNGRMGRIMTNLILRRYGLQPSDIKYDGEDKARYLDALCQIDKSGDYEPLKKLIANGMFSTYKKIYEVVQKHSQE